MLVQIFVPPVLQLLILAQAMTFQVSRTDMVLIDLDGSTHSAELVEQLTSSGRFQMKVRTASSDRADHALLTREANAILRIPYGFARDIQSRRGAPVQLILNAEDGASAAVVQGHIAQIINTFSQQQLTTGAIQVAASNKPGITIHTRALYNPQRSYLGYMAIGLMASLVTLIGVLLSSQNIAREKEIGTLEQLNVTPITRGQFILGKLTPFWILGLIELTLGLIIIRFAFGITFAGSVMVVYLSAGVYLLAALGLGLLISTVVSTQQQAQFVTFFAIVTLFFLGGIFTPIQSMPAWAQAIAELNPIKHFVFVLRSVLMKGATLADVMRPITAMAIFAGVTLTFAVQRYRKTAG